jgi:hypothetical protein
MNVEKEAQKLEEVQKNSEDQKEDKNLKIEVIQKEDEDTADKKEEEVQKKINYDQKINPNIFINQDLVKQFICPLCKGVLYDPIIPCKLDFKVYCKNCIEKYLENNENKCPNCQKTIENSPQKFDIVQASISCLDTKCKNEKSGCKWQGKYAFYDKHIDECPKEETHCVFEGCDKVCMRENLESHLKLCPFRVIMCDKCGMNIIASALAKHRDECPREVIKCPQKCGAKFERCILTEHKKQCPFTIIQCPFETIGCNEVIKRNEFYKRMHDNLPKHINMLLNDYLIFKEKSKKIWKEHGIELEEDNECKEKLQILNENFENIYKKVDNNNENQKEEDKKQEQIKEKIDINKFKKSPLMEEEKNQEKFVPIEKEEKTQNAVIQNHIKINQIKPLENKENLTLNKNNESLLNKKRERSEEVENEKNATKNNEADNPKANDNINNKEDDNEQTIYNSKDISKKFKINGNIIGSNCLEGNVHYFVFAHDSRKIKRAAGGTYIIRFEILEEVAWLSFGLCDKTIVEKNEFTFSGKFSNNGYCFIATNNVIWHCADMKQRKRIVCPPSITKIGAKGNIIECKYTPSTCMLLFYVNNVFLAGLYDVKPMQSDYLIPCLVFLKNCFVKTSFEYP